MTYRDAIRAVCEWWVKKQHLSWLGGLGRCGGWSRALSFCLLEGVGILTPGRMA